ncbi:MAG: DUF3467 domain-containing protein [Opitutales bacterium]
MSSETSPPPDPQTLTEPTAEPVRVVLSQRDLKTAYANGFQTHHLNEELIVDFGLQLPVRDENAEGKVAVSFELGQRIIMNYPTAARLANALAQAVQSRRAQLNPAGGSSPAPASSPEA